MMLLMMIFSISFAKNNCIFLKIFAFWNTCKRTACSYLRKNPSLLQGFTRISCFKMAKSCCFKVKIIAISRLKNHGYWLSSCQNRFAAGLPYKTIVSVCQEVCLTLNFLIWKHYFELVPNTTTRGCYSKFELNMKWKDLLSPETYSFKRSFFWLKSFFGFW